MYNRSGPGNASGPMQPPNAGNAKPPSDYAPSYGGYGKSSYNF
jgi:hypothetical protein